ncbi:MAG: hypothetical protein ACE5JD_05445 [Candidatus Methylomirabilia bacterium]
MLDLLWRWYDRAYLRVHRLRDPAAEVGPILRVEVRRHRGPRVSLPDSTEIRWGDRIGILHLSNERVAQFHGDGRDTAVAGLRFRRAFFASVRELARQVLEGDRYAGVKAFTGITILDSGTPRGGFEILPVPNQWWGTLVAAYERALLARYHPMGRQGAARARFSHARAIWISREGLLRRYGPEANSPNTTEPVPC